MPLKNTTMWPVQEEGSYSQETEWIEKYIASGGNIDDVMYYYDYTTGSFRPFFTPREQIPKNSSSWNGKWDAGIYLSLVVFLFLFFIIFTLRGKCRGDSVDDATIEQGRFVSCFTRNDSDDSDDEETSSRKCLGRFACCCCCKKKIGRKYTHRMATYNLNEKQQIPKLKSAREGQEKGKQDKSVENKSKMIDELKSQNGSRRSLYTIEECQNEEDMDNGNVKCI